MNVMLLAAGEGTRLRPFTYTLPKPAIPFLNVPLAMHALNFLSTIPVDKLVVNTYHLPEKIQNLFKSMSFKVREIHFSHEVGELLGSGGGLGKARRHFLGGNDFVMMNADEIILPVNEKVVEEALLRHKEAKNLATLLVTDHPGVGSQFGGVWTDGNNQVLGFGKQAIPGSMKAWHFIGVQILSEDVFALIPPNGASNILYDSLTQGIHKGQRVEVFPFQCQWFETGNLQDILNATEACLDILTAKEDSPAQKTLLRTLHTFDKKYFLKETAEATVLVGEGAQVGGRLTGFICAGAQCQIPESCELHNVIVGPGVQVPENTKAQNTLLI